jgi:hypothetical protein
MKNTLPISNPQHLINANAPIANFALHDEMNYDRDCAGQQRHHQPYITMKIAQKGVLEAIVDNILH